MPQPIQVQIVPPDTPKGIWPILRRSLVALWAVISGILAVLTVCLGFLSEFPEGKRVIVDLFGLDDPETPAVADIEAQTARPNSAPANLAPVGWSYLGKEGQPAGWYYPKLRELEMQDWVGEVVLPSTSIYLRSEPMSAVNPNPARLTVIGDSAAGTECLRIVGHRTSNTGSIWLQGALARCPE